MDVNSNQKIVKADLHVHSTLSDSSMDREEILKLAKEKGITHMSFTDHDTTVGSEKCHEYEKKYGIIMFKGIEISAFDFDTGKKVHILGYNYKTNENIEKLCTPLREKRHQNCLKQIEILKNIGYNIDIENVMYYAKSGYVYKQHILKYLFDTNQTDDIFGNVYRNIFKNGGECDIDIEYVSAEDAVKAIIKDGGVACLAHPGQQNNFDIVEKLVPLGLKAIEFEHHSHNDEMRVKVREVAEKFSLMLSGGSDYHASYEQVSTMIGEFNASKKFVEYLCKDYYFLET